MENDIGCHFPKSIALNVQSRLHSPPVRIGTLDQVRRRVTWLSAMGFLEYKTNTLVGLTEPGLAAVANLQLGVLSQHVSYTE